MRALLITALATLFAAAAGIGVLAISPAPDRQDSLTLVIETGSIPRTTASTEQRATTSAGDAIAPSTGALGASTSQKEAGRRQQTLDEVIAARLSEAGREVRDQGADPAARSSQGTRSAAQTADRREPAMPDDTQQPEHDFFAAAESAPSGTISITQMLAAELGNDAAPDPDAAQEAAPSATDAARSDRRGRSGDPVASAPDASDPRPRDTEVAALDPQVGASVEPGPARQASVETAPISESLEQLRDNDPAIAERTEAESRGMPLAVGAAPPAPSQRGRFRVKGRIALVVRGLGFNADLTARTIEAMPAQVALGFVPYGERLTDWTRKARQGRHDVLIQIPLEPQNYPETNPGPHTLLTSLPIDENLKRLDWLLDRFEGITGVSNYLGGKFAAAPGAFAPVLMELKARELVYIDDGKAANPTAQQLARQVSLSYAVADGVIDEGSRTPEAIAGALEKVEAIARSEGKAIAVGHAHGETLEALKAWIAGLQEKGLVLEPVKGLLAAPSTRQVSQTTGG